MKLLALDQSSKISGYAIYDDEKLIDYGKFSFDDPDLGIRLRKIKNKIRQLITDNNIEQVVFEDIQMQENVETFKILAMVLGVIEELLTELGLPHETVLASSWKSTLKIKGKQRAEQKRNAQSWVINMYNIKPTQDECDAICIGKHYLLQKIHNNWSF